MLQDFRHGTAVSKRHMSAHLTTYLKLDEIGQTIPPVVDGLIPTEFIPTPAGTTAFTILDKQKLDGIQAEAQKNVATNLSLGGTDDVVHVQSSTGNFVTLPIVSNLRAGLMTRSMFEKLVGIEEGAQKWRLPTLTELNLDQVDNTPDSNKPVSVSQQAALDLKEPSITAGTIAQYFSGTKTWRNLAADVRNVVLTGLSAGVASAIIATDTLLEALAKLQKQLDAKENALSPGNATQYFKGDKTLGSFVDDVKTAAIQSVLTGISFISGTAVVETDSILVAIGKLQNRINHFTTVTNALMAELINKASLAQANDFQQKMSVAGTLTVYAGAFTPSVPLQFSAAGINIDPAASNSFEVGTLTANTSLVIDSGVTGQTIQIRFQQDGIGNRTVSLPADVKASGTLLATANRASWLCVTKAANGNWEGNWFQVPS